ncbi:hypothetical protein [Aliidiomarina quisquiliarum]|uniref:hypothetical protein n=1 Tax=Aliidiomarina quisquiliarum TaxID=2938947 RepID=UPI00208FDDCF|nr:hypothetical protein [Aliidiomarina quisquiliarum]MCO4319889.1 hypothetical protein [Aliidiomarina quisquiliarum]
MSNPWGEKAITGYEHVSDIELENEIQISLLKEQGDLIEFATAKEIQGTLDEMLLGKSFRQGASIVAETPIGKIEITAPELGNEWFEGNNITSILLIKVYLEGIQVNKSKLPKAIEESAVGGVCEIKEDGTIVFKSVIDFTQSITDFDLRIALQDLMDYARRIYKKIVISEEFN